MKANALLTELISRLQLQLKIIIVVFIIKVEMLKPK